MSNINFGFNFTEETFSKIKELNDGDFPNKVASVYGSDKEHHYLSARPLYRFPEHADTENLFAYAKRLKDIGVKFWYTSNNISIGKKSYFDFENFNKLVKRLAEASIGMIVADMTLLEMISKCDIKPDVELSTIMRIESPRQLIAIKEQFPFVTKMVMHISYNRSFKLLKQFVKAGRYCGIEIEVLCNEACGTGYTDGATPCIHRDACYHCHGTNITLEDAKTYSSYPFNHCIGERYKSKSSWLNLFWILPEHMHPYTDIGIDSFKLTGRTATNHFTNYILPKYVEGKFDGNLLHIWKSIESINNNKADELQSKIFKIDTNKLENFLEPFVQEEIECHSRLCGIDCNYCEDYFEVNIK